MPGPSDTLNESGDAVRRSDLTDQIDMPDVDPQLERCRGDERLQLARSQPRFRLQPLFLREAAVVRRDRVFAKPLAQVVRQTLGHPPGVHEYERGAVAPISAASRS